ncbi:serine/threonine-protein kinase hal4 [Cordyceps militaris CM01]|uniref:Serine/threonine-protein kinase hal4 n=2 Tax=Cordyceps militaris TaxID=73501 RepID=G3JMQ7_CORMM|nr:serine/threonine-protein kinase hal4 [Cordyceps militaris CM01]ATY62954.1 serine threonine-kinase hal4 [Cordyceps militaris]EGX90089.1 serine/threonine-protein kinase hal4 [Cordyceps militaris CM01]
MAATLLRPVEPQAMAPPDSAATTDSTDAASFHDRHFYSHSFSSPRQYPADIPHPILEEEAAESGSESPIEPVTPVSSGRHSQDFTNVSQFDQNLTLTHYSTAQNPPTSNPKKTPQPQLPIDQTTPRQTPARVIRRARTIIGNTTAPTLEPATPTPKQSEPEPDAPQTGTLTRRSTRGSTSSFKRTMTNLFRRSSSAIERDAPVFDSSTPSSTDSVSHRNQAPTSAPRSIPATESYKTQSTASNSPPTPGSPLMMAPSNRSNIFGKSLPGPEDFQKKSRASTGFTLRGRAVNFVSRGGRNGKTPRRASSFDHGAGAPGLPPQQHAGNKMYPAERQPWALPPDAGTGTKARRMSLSLPDDFMIDTAELLAEFEYQHKLLGRHGKHLGKGAASKVTLMARKGCPNELYAVKEFRGKSKSESQDEYEKKIKSEFSIAKSLHHPNIVETIRLCTDHGRWNHVMEYCSEGDLFGLVQKGFFKGDAKLKDRLCIFKQLVQGVAYLHAHGIAHRDIKLENLLITKDSKIKITDFGVSEVFTGTHPGLREAHGLCGQNMGDVRLCNPGICGSEPYIAPEVLAKKGTYDPRALDVWGTGIVMLYLNFGGAIWSRAEPGNTHYDKLVKGWERWYNRHPDPEAAITDTDYPKCLALDVGVNPPALRRVLLQMLNPDPSRRISIHEAASNRWMKNIECCQVESYDDPTLCIDATKSNSANNRRIFCHSHLPPKTMGSHSLGKMPGQPGY